MTVGDWINESASRFRTQPPQTAARHSSRALLRGALRRIGGHIGRPIWVRGDWDVLVVLDACRVDLWEEVAPEYGLPSSGSITSNASCSIDWIIRNFNHCPEDARRAGYITGNPFADHDAEEARSAGLSNANLAHFAPLYKTEWGPIDGGPVETIPPDTLTDHGISAWRERDQYEMDRLIIHYMQPHQPYRSRPDWVGVNKNLKNLVRNRSKAGACAWQQARVGAIDVDELWDAYADNLRWVLDDVTDRLLPNVEGRVVLTADHGNAMGEWGEWAHPPGALSPAVRKVPWVEVDAADTETVIPDIRATESDTEAEEQLKALGYL